MDKLLLFRLENANGDWNPNDIEGLSPDQLPLDDKESDKIWGCTTLDDLVRALNNNQKFALLGAGYTLQFLVVDPKDDVIVNGSWVIFPKSNIIKRTILRESFLYGVKQVIVVRKDLMKGNNAVRKGKMMAQVAHASIGAMLSFFQRSRCENLATGEITYRCESIEEPINPLNLWLNEKFTKVVVGIEDEEKLLELHRELVENQTPLPYALITDSGLTEFHGVPTVTCLGIGPWLSTEIDKITKNLQLL